jgi:hypothetical protein
MISSAPPTHRTSAIEACVFMQRALLMWPRLDRQKLARCGCDPYRIARLVARRSNLSIESIAAILEPTEPVDREPPFFFG